jgi:hypothetical protein
VPGPVKVKVVALIVAGFIAWLKVAVTTVVQRPAAPLIGVSEITVGGIKPRLVPVLSGSLRQVATRSRVTDTGAPHACHAYDMSDSAQYCQSE